MKELLTTLLCSMVLSATAQMAPDATFKDAFKQHMLTPTEKPKLSFYQRDVLHHNLAGGLLATVGIPVLAASTLGYKENQGMAITGFIFGGLATAGAVALQTIGIKKLVQYHKQGKLNDAFVE